jgi:hypothetical protein
MQGGSVASALKSAVNFIRKNKAISRTANALAEVGVPYASKVAHVASKLGAGKRRRRRGRGAGSTSLNYAVKY